MNDVTLWHRDIRIPPSFAFHWKKAVRPNYNLYSFLRFRRDISRWLDITTPEAHLLFTCFSRHCELQYANNSILIQDGGNSFALLHFPPIKIFSSPFFLFLFFSVTITIATARKVSAWDCLVGCRLVPPTSGFLMDSMKRSSRGSKRSIAWRR